LILDVERSSILQHLHFRIMAGKFFVGPTVNIGCPHTRVRKGHDVRGNGGVCPIPKRGAAAWSTGRVVDCFKRSSVFPGFQFIGKWSDQGRYVTAQYQDDSRALRQQLFYEQFATLCDELRIATSGKSPHGIASLPDAREKISEEAI